MHIEEEFQTIRNEIARLREAAETNDETTIVDCLLGKDVNINAGYLRNAKSHSKDLYLGNDSASFLQVKAYLCEEDGFLHEFMNGEPIAKSASLLFRVSVPRSFGIKELTFVVSYADYEAEKDQRGEMYKYEKTEGYDPKAFSHSEHAKYYGRHFIQARLITTFGRTFIALSLRL